MKNTIIILLFILGYAVVFGQNKHEWEYCSEGLEGFYWLISFEFENEIYESILGLISKDTAKTWVVTKYNIGKIYPNHFYFFDMFKYRNKYLGFSGNHYYSFDKNNWHLIYKYNGIPNSVNQKYFFATDSTFLIQVFNPDDFKNRYRTYITKDSADFKFNLVEKDMPNEYIIFNCTNINGILFATSSSSLYIGKYYYSSDGGMNWQYDSIPNIPEKLKYVKYLNNRFYIISSMGLWGKDNSGNWYECKSDELLKPMTRDILVAFKDKIITHSSINGVQVLVSSSDEGKTWERFGSSNFYIRQLLVKGNTLIAFTHLGVMTSIDDGKTWLESNHGLFASTEKSDNSTMQIVSKDNEVLTAPRNKMINNVIMKSYNNGKTWSKKQIDTSFSQPEQMQLTKDWYSVVQTKWGVFAINGYGNAYKTDDFGETWYLYSKTSGGVFLNTRNLYERNDTMFCFFSSSIYYSTDKGVSFNLSEIKYRENLPDSCWHWTIIDGIHYALNKYFKFYKSENEGRNWEYVSTFDLKKEDSGFPQIIFIDGNRIYFMPVSGPNQPVFVSDDFGKNWKEVDMPIPKMAPHTWLKHNGSIYIVYIENFQTSIYASSDNCKSWVLVSEGLGNKEITDIFSAGDYIYASTKEGLYKAYTETNDVKIEIETLFPIEFYPMPVNDKINIKNNYYKLINVKVYDVTGKEYPVSRFSNHEFELPSLKAGVYITMLIFEGNWSITKKFIKM